MGPTTPVGRVVLPRSFYDFYGTYYCPPGRCYDGIEISGGLYDVANGQARFWPNNPYGPAMTTTTVRFKTYTRTVGGVPITNTAVPNTGMGNPVTPTSTYGGLYDFSRAGSIQIQEGPNKFSGTMRWIWGPKSYFYQLITGNYPYVSKAWGTFKDPTEYDEAEVGELDTTGMVTRWRYTPALQNKATDGNGNYISAVVRYMHSAAPWTTGRVEGYQPLGDYLTRLTLTGYDNRLTRPTPMWGVTRKLSLVRPRLVHSYISDDTGIDVQEKAFVIWNLQVFFTPEPGRVLLLSAGAVILMVLIRLRRR
ncbi:MAG TPA: hypothetical protein VIY27_06810 [Myxococcota bacterium]